MQFIHKSDFHNYAYPLVREKIIPTRVQIFGKKYVFNAVHMINIIGGYVVTP